MDLLNGVVSENRSEVNRRSGMVAELRNAGLDPDKVAGLGEFEGIAWILLRWLWRWKKHSTQKSKETGKKASLRGPAKLTLVGRLSRLARLPR